MAPRFLRFTSTQENSMNIVMTSSFLFYSINVLLLVNKDQIILKASVSVSWKPRMKYFECRYTSIWHFFQYSRRDIPAANFVMHVTHCQRNLTLCKACGEPVPTSQQEEHFEEYHAEVCWFVHANSLRNLEFMPGKPSQG